MLIHKPKYITQLCCSLISLNALMGCVSLPEWPEAGSGGAAERAPLNYNPVYADQPLGPEHGLRFDLELTARHLDMLVLEGAELCFPATVVQSKIRENRIRRELDGGLEFAAANDILIQRKLLARLEQQLDYVKKHDICTVDKLPIAEDKPGDLAGTLFDLLNADNQFAHDSFELNPKYVGRLAEAAQLLKKAPMLHLNIVGYADDSGSEEYNQSLSKSRAEKVARYLNVLGVDKTRMKVTALGEVENQYEGNEPHIRLVNRSVSIDIINTQQGAPLTPNLTSGE